MPGRRAYVQFDDEVTWQIEASQHPFRTSTGKLLNFLGVDGIESAVRADEKEGLRATTSTMASCYYPWLKNTTAVRRVQPRCPAPLCVAPSTNAHEATMSSTLVGWTRLCVDCMDPRSHDPISPPLNLISGLMAGCLGGARGGSRMGNKTRSWKLSVVRLRPHEQKNVFRWRSKDV
ncbi:hypothetical protein U9M48_004605 [Paspalum notatum var. saurae]|uniref:Uncharacterized protein n=1 Tax=Paspalum notatum var. saurae TaxID=547442 RepID=A0AAQ3SKX5_PASNO